LRSGRILFLLVLLVVLAAVVFLLQEMERRHLPPRPRVPEEPSKEAKAPTPLPSPPAERPKERRNFQFPPKGPQIVIIIDDLGYNGQNYRSFLEIGYPLTFAVLPSLPYSQRIAKEARDKDREVLLHLPLEPQDYPAKNPGKGVLLASMSQQEMRKVFIEDLESVPGATGVNSHMGSKLTGERGPMMTLLSELKRRNLYFVDSLTTKATIVTPLARKLGVRAGARDIFLDNYQDRAYIEGQLDLLAKVAQKKGEAIGVGHPYPITAAVLKDRLPRWEKEGIRVVSASRIVH
jgi:polysaccharide deacetylase 2 family uncharacterized protein YibQ